MFGPHESKIILDVNGLTENDFLSLYDENEPKNNEVPPSSTYISSGNILSFEIRFTGKIRSQKLIIYYKTTGSKFSMCNTYNYYSGKFNH